MSFLSEHPYFVSDLDVFADTIVYDSFTKLLLYILFFFPVSKIHPMFLVLFAQTSLPSVFSPD